MAKDAKLNAKNFGLAGGIIWGGAIALATAISVATGYMADVLPWLAKVYPGYALSYGGALMGGIIGFVDMFIGCYIFAWLYNWLCSR